MISKSDSRCAVVRFWYHSNDYRPNWTPLSPITITYSCQLSDLASEWQRRWCWPCIDTNQVVLMLTRLLLHRGGGEHSATPGTFCVSRSFNKVTSHPVKSELSGKIKFQYGIIVLSVSKMPIFRNRPDIFNILFDQDKQNFVFFLVISVFLKNRAISYSKTQEKITDSQFWIF